MRNRFRLGFAAFLLAAAVFAGTQNRPAEKWFVITLGGTPVGSVRESSAAKADGVVATESDMKMVLNRLGSRVEIAALSRTEESPDGRLSRLSYEIRASLLATRTVAVIQDGRIEVRSEAGGKSYTRTVPFTGTLLGPEGIRLLSVARLKAPGDRVEFQTFAAEVDKVSRGSRTAVGWETVHVGDRDLRLLKVEEVLEAAGTKSSAWLDESREAVQQEMPTPFGAALIVQATRDQALEAEGGGSLPEELYARSIIKANIRPPRARALTELIVRLTRRDPGGEWPDIGGPSQKILDRTASTLDLEIRRPPLPGSFRRPVPMSDAVREFLAPNAYIQSDDPELRKTASGIIGEETDVWKAALKLRRWVTENMRFDLGIAFAPSTELFKDRRGTCVGYATILATLARAAGIPSRVAIGYVYALGMFGGHAWTEILAGETWLPLDAALPSSGAADAARFNLGTSSLYEGAGSLTGGAAQQIFGQVALRIMAYAGEDGSVVPVPQDARPYWLQGDSYRNSWLGVELAKPADWKFVKLDAVWPDSVLVGMEGPGGASAELHEDYPRPWLKPEEALRSSLSREVPSGKERAAALAGRPAIVVESPGRAAAAVSDGPGNWVFVVAGKDAPAILARLMAGFKLGKS